MWVSYFVWNFKGNIWNSTQTILPICWKIWFWYKIEILWALRCESSNMFLKRPLSKWSKQSIGRPISRFCNYKANPSVTKKRMDCWPPGTGCNMITIHECDSNNIIISDSAWWLLMAWRLFGICKNLDDVNHYVKLVVSSVMSCYRIWWQHNCVGDTIVYH